MSNSFKLQLSPVIGSIISFLIPALIIALLPSGGQLANTPDSLSYLEVSHQIASGMGLTISNFSLFDMQLVEFTTWPPLFPLILASGIAPLWIQAMLIGAIGMITYRIFHHLLKQNIPLSILMSLSCSLTFPMLVDASYVWSETLSILFICMLIYSLTKICIGSYRTPWAMAVVFIALAIYARYSMFLLVPGMMISLLAAPINRSLRIKLSLITPFAVLLLISPLIIHSYFSTGHISGAQRGPSGLNILDNFNDAISNTFTTFIFKENAPWNEFFFICLLALASVAIYSIKYERQGKNKTLNNSITPSIRVVKISFILALSYFVGMIVLRTIFSFDQLDTRLMSPVAYLLSTAICAGLISTWILFANLQLWKRYVLISPFIALIIFSAYNSLIQGTEAWKDWRATGSPQWHINSVSNYTNFQPVNAPKIEGIVLCNHPLLVKFYTGWDVRQIPDEPWSDIDLKRVATSARAILINGPRPRMLAQRIQPLLKNYTERSFEGSTLLSWHDSEHQK